MSLSHYVDIKIAAPYNEDNVKKILARGVLLGLNYFDHIPGEMYVEAPKIDSDAAAEKILFAFKNKVEGGPCVYVQIKDKNYGYLCFRLSEEDFIEVTLGGFSSPEKKEVMDYPPFINFALYIKLLLDMCQDFVVLDLRTETV